MNRLSETLKSIIDKWKNLTRGRKIAFGVIFAGVLAALLYLGVSLGSTKYEVLFANMDSKDSAAVYTALTAKKAKVKIQGNTILVPKDQVDELRMEVLSSVNLSQGSQGFELLDKSKFGATDTEMKINYQRALQGELERTIKYFPQIDGARVNIVMPDDTDFVKDTTPGKAFVTLKLKPEKKLSTDQVKAIVSLISGSVKNIPKENVEVTDTVSLLTKNLYNKDKINTDDATSTEKQQQLKTQYEKQLQTKVSDMLEAVYGKDKVKVLVNTDLNFDAQQKNITTYDPKNVPISEQSEKQTTNSTGTQASGSPVDNAMVNKSTANTDGSTTTSEKKTTNYNVSKTEESTITAPGVLKRLTTSVVIDGSLDDAAKASVKNLVISAVGYNEARGDSISVESMAFDTTAKDNAKKDLDAINKSIEQQNKTKMYRLIGIAAGALLVLSVIGFSLYKKKKEKDEEILPKGIDVMIGDENDLTQPIDKVRDIKEAKDAKDTKKTENNIENIENEDEESLQKKKKIKFKPVDLDVENERTHIENEIKKYALQKPEQVAEIIKSWLADDER